MSEYQRRYRQKQRDSGRREVLILLPADASAALDRLAESSHQTRTATAAGLLVRALLGNPASGST